MDFSHEALKLTFGNIPERYDDVRPGYPAEVIDSVLQRAAKAPLRALEVGCGTGRATRLFAERGHRVLALDLSGELVALARRQLSDLPNVDFEIGPFETFAAPEHSFDLIFSAQAFHWVEPAAGLAQVCRLLAPGGALALFWNFVHYDASPLLARLRDTCAAYVPMVAGWPDASNARLIAFANQWRSAVGGAPCLDLVIETIKPTLQPYSHDRFLTLVTTYSWFLAQPQPVRDALLADLRALLASAPEPLMLTFRTLLITAVKPLP